MARSYTEEQIHSVLEGNDIVEVISQYVPLKKSGNHYMGRCPFHHEKTPSFSVSADKQLYHCFGCGAGGDLITFVRNIENLSFIESVQYLADRANIPLPETGDMNDEESKKRDALYRMHKDAARFFYKNRRGHQKANEYLLSRGIEEETIRQFALGYAGTSYTALYEYLKSKGYRDEDMKDSGLVLPDRRGGYRDRFIDRIMFPIISVAKNVTGFGGRLLKKSDKLPKYLNSAETMIFHKGNQLYGLNLAKTNIEDGRLIAVEGYMDVISLYQGGIKNAVASLGTALTSGQGRLMKRYVEEVVLCYDGDAAGLRATLRGIQVLEDLDLRVKVMNLKNNMDPDDFIRQEGREAFKELVDHALPTVDFRIGLLEKEADLTRSDEKIRFVTEASKILKEIKKPIEQEMQIRRFAKKMGIDPGVLFREVEKEEVSQDSQSDKEGAKVYAPTRRQFHREAQELLIGWLYNDLEAGKEIASALSLEHFQKGIYRDAADHAYRSLGHGALPSASAYIGTLESEDHRKLLSKILMEVEEPSEEALRACFRAMEITYAKRYIAYLQKKMEDFSLNEEEFNQLYCAMVDKKKELEQMQNLGREIL